MGIATLLREQRAALEQTGAIYIDQSEGFLTAAEWDDLERLCFHADPEELVDTAVQQPALVATSLAVLAAIRARGIEPDYVVGHSVGEFAASAGLCSQPCLNGEILESPSAGRFPRSYHRDANAASACFPVATPAPRREGRRS